MGVTVGVVGTALAVGTVRNAGQGFLLLLFLRCLAFSGGVLPGGLCLGGSLLVPLLLLQALLAGVLGNAVGVFGPALGADALLLRLNLVLLHAALQALGILGIVDFAVVLVEVHILNGTDHAADEPVKGQGAGNGEANPQHHQGHGKHHNLIGLGGLGVLHGILILDAVLVGHQGVVLLLHNQHGHHLITGGGQGNQQRADMGPVPGPAGSEHIQGGHSTQVDADKAEVDAAQGQLTDAGNGGLDGLGVLGNVLGRNHLVIIGVAGEELGVDALNHLYHLVGNVQVLMKHIDNGLPDNGVKGNQQQHGHEAPQAAAAHGNALFLIKLLQSLVLAVGVVGIAALDILHSGSQPGHLHHALFGLGGDGQQHQLHNHGKQNQGRAVVSGKPVKQFHQIAEGNLNHIGNVE